MATTPCRNRPPGAGRRLRPCRRDLVAAKAHGEAALHCCVEHCCQLRCLTFELSGRQRQAASARTVKMYRVPPARAWRPTVGARLAPTLGSAIGSSAPPSNEVRLRRELQQPRGRAGEVAACAEQRAGNGRKVSRPSRLLGQHRWRVNTSKGIEALRGTVCGSLQLRRLSCSGSAAMAAIVPSLATGGGSGGQQQASVSVRLPRRTVAGGHAVVPGNVSINTALPNPSLKRSATGRPPAPGRWYAVHFHRPGAGVLPSAPA